MPLVKVMRHGFAFWEMTPAPKEEQLDELPEGARDSAKRTHRSPMTAEVRETIEYALKRGMLKTQIAREMNVGLYTVQKIERELLQPAKRLEEQAAAEAEEFSANNADPMVLAEAGRALTADDADDADEEAIAR